MPLKNNMPLKKNTASMNKKGTGKKKDAITCEVCKVLSEDENDKLMSCDRCSKWYCVDCIDMSNEIYSFYVTNTGEIWYCPECKGKALAASKTDYEIETRCNEFLKKFEIRVDAIESNLETKADIADFECLKTQMQRFEEKIKGINCDMIKMYDELELWRSESKEIRVAEKKVESKESKEKDRRKNNVIIFGLPDNQDKDEDLAKVTKILDILGTKEMPTKVERIGVPSSDLQKVRPVRIIFPSLGAKMNTLKYSAKLRYVNNGDIDARNIFINPDMTLSERREDAELRKKLSERKLSDPNWKISRGKIVRKVQANRGDSEEESIARSYSSVVQGSNSFTRNENHDDREILAQGRNQGRSAQNVDSGTDIRSTQDVSGITTVNITEDSA